MKRIFSLILALLLLSGCAASSGNQSSGGESDLQPGPDPAFLRYAQAQPVYPAFPTQPQVPEEGSQEDWEAYDEAYQRYIDALDALRGLDSGLAEGEHAALNAFAVRSAPLALAGREGENTVYSPLSLWSALAMLARCAEGDSRQQVLEAVGADSVDALQDQAEHIWRRLYTDDGLSSLILGNSIWLNSAVQGSYVQETLDTLAQKHYAGVYSAPIGTEEADQAVTEWVREQTGGLIGSDGPVVETDPETLALLVSSLYYRAAWTEKFMPGRTETDTFTGPDGQETQTDFMHQTQDAAHFIRREGYQAAHLGTELGEMVFVLPDQGIAPESLLQDPEFLSRLEFYGDAAIWGEVRWSVPKFDVRSNLDLMDTFSALGIADLLDRGRADLSALTNLDAFVSEAKQLTRVKVDEEGMEAAAVTTMMVAPTSAVPDPDPEICVMDLDRPFLFVVRFQDVPLFVGIVNQV